MVNGKRNKENIQINKDEIEKLKRICKELDEKVTGLDDKL